MQKSDNFWCSNNNRLALHVIQHASLSVTPLSSAERSLLLWHHQKQRLVLAVSGYVGHMPSGSQWMVLVGRRASPVGSGHMKFFTWRWFYKQNVAELVDAVPLFRYLSKCASQCFSPLEPRSTSSQAVVQLHLLAIWYQHKQLHNRTPHRGFCFASYV